MNNGTQQIEETTLAVSIGYEIKELLHLKFDKAGRTKTSWGSKSIEGLGKCILRIVEEQQARLKQ